jgi:hypothetical protein
VTSDRERLDALIWKHFPEIQVIVCEFDAWARRYDRVWGYRHGTARAAICHRTRDDALDRLGLPVAELGARLIYADRRHAADWKPVTLPSAEGESALHRFHHHCRSEAALARASGVAEELLAALQQKKSEALSAYRSGSEGHTLTLNLSTGYGKTLAGLRVALESIRTGRCQRILYVAPYISVLSQSARVLEKATGLPVVLHHQMSILSFAGPSSVATSQRDDLQGDDYQPYDLLETWQEPMVATTFNQLFRAPFPARAQQCLRIPALDRAFIFIDEPQIIDPAIWSALLRAIAVVATQRGAQVLFCTATLPPVEEGLDSSPAPRSLTKHVPHDVNRFIVRSSPDSWNADQLVNEAEK